MDKGKRRFHTGDRRKPQEQKKPTTAVTGARRVALDALYDVYYADAYANLALDKHLRKVNLSDEDKRLATSIFYSCIENKLQIEYILAPFVKAKPENALVCILHIACAQILYLDKIPNHAAVNEAVKQAHAFHRDEESGFINGVLRSLLRAIEANEVKLPDENADRYMYLSIKYSVPIYVLRLLDEAYGEDMTEKIISYKHTEHYETVRANLLRTSEAELEKYFDDNGYSWTKGRLSDAYRVSKAGAIAKTAEYARGMYSVQGESAMLAARALEPKSGQTILDCCAAPGGKAAYICELMHGSGRVHAWDLHEHRVELIKSNGKRLGLDNLRCAERDASVLREELIYGMDGVIIDAPCSGLGVIADKPDIKYRLNSEKLKEIISDQKAILAACSQYVKKGGLLVYSTCTILPKENEQQIKAFLLENPDFRMETDVSYLPEDMRGLAHDGMLTLLQSRDDVEGFFIARMRRVK